jgi:hypothetical protein
LPASTTASTAAASAASAAEGAADAGGAADVAGAASATTRGGGEGAGVGAGAVADGGTGAPPPPSIPLCHAKTPPPARRRTAPSATAMPVLDRFAGAGCLSSGEDDDATDDAPCDAPAAGFAAKDGDIELDVTGGGGADGLPITTVSPD